MFRDDERSPRWTLLIPAFMALGILAGLVTADWGAHDTSFIVWLLVRTIAVGIAEETLTRGLVLTAMRGGMGEVGAWFWSSLLFGLLHGANVVLGQDVGPTLQQIVFAFVFGSVLYAARRSTGTLLVPIVLHALWDFRRDARRLTGAEDASRAGSGARYRDASMWRGGAAMRRR